MDLSVTTKKLETGEVVLFGQCEERVNNEANALVALGYNVVKVETRQSKQGKPYYGIFLVKPEMKEFSLKSYR